MSKTLSKSICTNVKLDKCCSCIKTCKYYQCLKRVFTSPIICCGQTVNVTPLVLRWLLILSSNLHRFLREKYWNIEIQRKEDGNQVVGS